MKYNLLLTIILAFLLNHQTYAKNNSQNGYKIEISAPSYKGSTVYFASYWAGNPYIKDSVTVDKKGQAIFESNTTLPTGQYLLSIGRETQIELLIDEEEQSNIKIDVNKDVAKSKISGSRDTEILWKYLISLQNQNAKNDQQEIPEESWATTFIKANQSIKEPHPETKENDKIKENIDYVRSHFFDNVRFTDERLWNTSFFFPMVNSYLERWIPQHPDTIAMQSSWIVSQTMGNDYCFEQMLSQLVNQATTSKVMGMENVWAKLAEDYIFDKNIGWISDSQYMNLKAEYSLIEKNRLGMKAQDLTLITINKDTINTNEIEANYLLLFFYSPTCSHCHHEIKELATKFYPEYKDKGIKIVTINTASNLDEWQKYIDDHGMSDWINAADPNYKSQYWLKYDVSGTPSMYLLNKNKTIIARKLNVENLIKYIERF